MAGEKVIILPIDFSELSQGSVPWGRRMAAVMEGVIHCIYTVEPPHIYSALDMAPAIPLPTTEELGKNAKTQLDAFVSEHLAGLDPQPVTQVLTGNPAEQIVAYANDHECRNDHHDDPRLQRPRARRAGQHDGIRPAACAVPGPVDSQQITRPRRRCL